MNFKRTMRFSGVAVCICSASLADNADAQTAGSITTSVGWLHIAPQGDATPLIVQSVGGVTVNRQLAGTGAHASSTDTLGITTEYYVTDNLGVAMLLGMPLKVNLIGDGTLQKYGTLGTTRPMPPAIELRYHLFSATSKFRPYRHRRELYVVHPGSGNQQPVRLRQLWAGRLGARDAQLVVEPRVRFRGKLRDFKTLVGRHLRQLHAGEDQPHVIRTDRDRDADRFQIDARLNPLSVS